MKRFNVLAISLFILLMAILLTVLYFLYLLATSPLIDRFDNPFEEEMKEGDASAIFKKVRTLLDKYDNPEVLEHAVKVMTMDPGELARMQLNVKN